MTITYYGEELCARHQADNMTFYHTTTDDFKMYYTYYSNILRPDNIPKFMTMQITGEGKGGAGAEELN